MQQLKDIHIGTHIKQKFEETSMSITDFANRIHCERTTVYDIFDRKSIDVELLVRISDVLNFDFYNEIYLNKKTNNFSKKVFIAFEIEEKNIDKSALPDKLIKLLIQN